MSNLGKTSRRMSDWSLERDFSSKMFFWSWKLWVESERTASVASL